MDATAAAPHPEGLVDALAAAFLDLSPDEQRLAVIVYETLLQGRPATIEELATASGWSRAAVGERLHGWPGVFFDSDGCVVGFWGVATEEMPHRVEIGDAVTWAWCAFDPLFIMPLVGRTAIVSSPCPVTRETVSLTVTPDAVVQVHPPDAMVSFLTPDRRFDADVRVSFCHYVLFFASRDAGERWTGDHPGTFVLSVEEAAEVGRRTARAVFPHVPGGAGI